MKSCKKCVAMLLAFSMLLSIAVPANRAKAYFFYTGSISEIYQTDATNTTVTIGWTPVADAVAYRIKVDGAAAGAYVEIPASQTSFTLDGLSEGVSGYLNVVPVGQDATTGEQDEGYGTSVKVRTLSTVSNLTARGYGFNYNKPYKGLDVKYDTSWDCDGYQLVLYNKKGKKIQTINTMSSSSGYQTFKKAKRTEVYYVKARTYITVAGGVKKYGDWSAKYYAVPQPIVTSSKKDMSTHAIKFKWKKVNGATSYTVYRSTNSSSRGKKVKTLKGNKTSCTVKGVNLNKNTYYLTVVANCKVGKKTYKSLDSESFRFYRTYY